MGVIINDELTLSTGLTVTGAYSAIFETRVNKVSSDSYDVSCVFRIWKDLDSRNANIDYILTIPVTINLTKSQLSTIFPLLFTQFKTLYESTTDAF